jgi:hypothetical protein
MGEKKMDKKSRKQRKAQRAKRRNEGGRLHETNIEINQPPLFDEKSIKLLHGLFTATPMSFNVNNSYPASVPTPPSNTSSFPPTYNQYYGSTPMTPQPNQQSQQSSPIIPQWPPHIPPTTLIPTSPIVTTMSGQSSATFSPTFLDEETTAFNKEFRDYDTILKDFERKIKTADKFYFQSSADVVEKSKQFSTFLKGRKKEVENREMVDERHKQFYDISIDEQLSKPKRIFFQKTSKGIEGIWRPENSLAHTSAGVPIYLLDTKQYAYDPTTASDFKRVCENHGLVLNKDYTQSTPKTKLFELLQTNGVDVVR